MGKKQAAFRIDEELLTLIAHVKETQGVTGTAQVEMALRDWFIKGGWLQKRGAMPKPRGKKR